MFKFRTASEATEATEKALAKAHDKQMKRFNRYLKKVVTPAMNKAISDGQKYVDLFDNASKGYLWQNEYKAVIEANGFAIGTAWNPDDGSEGYCIMWG